MRRFFKLTLILMPIYEYRCGDCGHEFETIQKISEDPLTVCPACNENALVKKISAAGFRLKGGGWYETDFKSGGKRNVIGATDGGGGGGSDGGSDGGSGGDSGSGSSTDGSSSSSTSQSSESSSGASKADSSSGSSTSGKPASGASSSPGKTSDAS